MNGLIFLHTLLDPFMLLGIMQYDEQGYPIEDESWEDDEADENTYYDDENEDLEDDETNWE